MTGRGRRDRTNSFQYSGRRMASLGRQPQRIVIDLDSGSIGGGEPRRAVESIVRALDPCAVRNDVRRNRPR